MDLVVLMHSEMECVGQMPWSSKVMLQEQYVHCLLTSIAQEQGF
jgi:hypothetical protein